MQGAVGRFVIEVVVLPALFILASYGFPWFDVLSEV